MRSVLSIERELRRYAGAIQARYVARLKDLVPDTEPEDQISMELDLKYVLFITPVF